MKKILINLLVVLIFITKVFSQTDSDVSIDNYTKTIIPPSPDAWSMTRVGFTEPTKFKGSANVSIPIYTYRSAHLSVPISFNYNSNGVKVDEMASFAGLQWNLTAGGVINRIVKDDPDERNVSFIPKNIDVYSTKSVYFIKNAYDGKWDTEPDSYLFNFVGHNGKFIIDLSTGLIHTIPVKNLKIEFLADNVIKITDAQGIVYLFGENGAYETTTNYHYGVNCKPDVDSDFPDDEPVITSWFLTTIIHPTGDIVHFEYENTYYSYFAGFSERLQELISIDNGNCVPTDGGTQPTFSQLIYSACIRKPTISGKVLKRIYSEHYGEVQFHYSSRQDGDSKRLEWIKVLNPNGVIISKWNLVHFYSQNTSFQNNVVNSTSPNLLRRMFLKEIIKYGADTNKVEEEYSFEYNNPDGLPARLSMSQDHWGYYNGKYNTTFLPKGLYAEPYRTQSFADRECNPATSGFGLLTKITYPTGGFQVLEYEPNTFFSGLENIVTGGMRVKKLLLYDKDGSLRETKKFIYASIQNMEKSSGVSLTNNEVCYSSLKYNRKFCDGLDPVLSDETRPYSEALYQIVSSNTLLPLVIQGGEAVYTSVLEKQTDEHNNISYLETKYNYVFNRPPKLIYGKHDISGVPRDNDGFFSGEIASKKYYTQKNGVLRKVKSIDYNYQELPTLSDTIYGYVIRKNFDEKIGKTQVNYTCTADDIGKWDGLLTCTDNKWAWAPLVFRHFNVDGHEWDQFARPFVKKPHTRAEVDGTKWAWLWYWESPCTSVGQVVKNYDLLNNGAYDVMQYRIYSKFRYLSKKTTKDYPVQGGEFKTEENYYYENLKSLAPTKIVVETSENNLPQTTYIKYPSDFKGQNLVKITNYKGHVDGYGTKVANRTGLYFIPISTTTIEGTMSIDRNDTNYIENLTPTKALLSIYDVTEDSFVDSYNLNEGPFSFSFSLNASDTYLLSVAVFGSPMKVDFTVNQFNSKDNILNKNINKLLDKNLVSNIITKSVVKGDTFIKKLDFQYNDSNQVIKIFDDTTILGEIYAFDPTKIYNDKNKVLEKKYSERGNLIEQIYKQNHVAYLWGYNKTKPIARVENASYKDIFHTSFEETGIVTPNAYSGSRCNYATFTKSLTGIDNGPYILEYFVRNGDIWEMKHANINVSANGYTININEPGKLIDEVRFYPQNAQMTTYTYEPLIGITGITDPRGETTRYVYDDFGRLKYIKDRNGNVLKRYSYHYYNQPVTEDYNVELYTVTASTNGYGTVTIIPEKVKKGSSASVNITPYTGYKISSITVDGLPQSINSSFTISNVQKDITVDVQFAIKTYTVTKTIDGGTGSVSISPTTVNHGGSTTVSLYPGSGYMVDYVKVGTTTYPVSNNKATISGITSNINVHVKFKPSVSLTVNPGYLSFDFVGSHQTVTVTASGSWTATASASWILIIPNSGTGNGTFDVSVLKNNDATRRTGHVTVTNGSSSVTISVEQAAGLGGFK